jgi:hypothetical protein
VSGWHIFLWGFCGSMAADAVRFRNASDSSHARLPALYRRPHFYISVVLMAVTGGVVAFAVGADKPWLAFQIGASTPLILQNLSQNPPTLPPSN